MSLNFKNNQLMINLISSNQPQHPTTTSLTLILLGFVKVFWTSDYIIHTHFSLYIYKIYDLNKKVSTILLLCLNKFNNNSLISSNTHFVLNFPNCLIICIVDFFKSGFKQILNFIISWFFWYVLLLFLLTYF